MRFATYVFLLLSISIVFYFLGNTSILSDILSRQGDKPIDPANILGLLASEILSGGLNTLGPLIGVASIAAVVSLLGGYSATFIIPLLILLIVLNYTIFPLSFLLSPDLPALIKIPLWVTFNILTILALLDFVRGRV